MIKHHVAKKCYLLECDNNTLEHEGRYPSCEDQTQINLSLAVASYDKISLEHYYSVCYDNRSKDPVLG